MGGDDAAREVADRIFVWGSILGVILACVQWFALPRITPWFSPLAEVREAVKGPAAISSFIHLVNGLVFGKLFFGKYPSYCFSVHRHAKNLYSLLLLPSHSGGGYDAGAIGISRFGISHSHWCFYYGPWLSIPTGKYIKRCAAFVSSVQCSSRTICNMLVCTVQ